jgi:hypothetical protein
MPLAYSKRGDKVLLEVDGDKLLYYEKENQGSED